MHLSSSFALLPLHGSCSNPWFSHSLLLCCSYILRELVAKNALALSSLPDYLSDWVNVHSSLCVYTTKQTSKFPESHLQAAGWYLDCSAGFVPVEEKPLFDSLVTSAPEDNIVTFEEPDTVEIPPPPPKVPRGKGRAKKSGTQASSQVVTRSGSKPSFEPPTLPLSPSLAPSVPPSVAPSGTPSAFPPQSNATPSQSGTSLLSLPRKRKAALLDTSATSSESPTTLALIENVDMVQLMLDSEIAGSPVPAYTRIQEFIAKVCMFSFAIDHTPFRLDCFLFLLHVFSFIFPCRLGQVVPV